MNGEDNEYPDDVIFAFTSPCVNCHRPVATPVSPEELILFQTGVLIPLHLCQGCAN